MLKLLHRPPPLHTNMPLTQDDRIVTVQHSAWAATTAADSCLSNQQGLKVSPARCNIQHGETFCLGCHHCCR